MAHIDENEGKKKIVPTHIELSCRDKDLDSTACTSPNKLQLLDLYTVRSEELEEFKINPLLEVPFVHGIAVNGLHDHIVHIRGVFDCGTMVNTMCLTIYNKIKHRLSPLQKLNQQLRTANSSIRDDGQSLYL